jgi:AraC-like DNA-binding protein
MNVNEIIYAGKHLLTYSVSRHAHGSWELIYCTGGEGSLVFEDAAVPYQAGDLVVIPPMLMHRNESEQGFTNIHINMQNPSLPFRTPALIHDDSNHFILDAFTAAFYHFSAEPGKQSPLLAAYANLIVYQILAGWDAPKRSPVVEEIEHTIICNYPDEGFELDRYLHTLPFNYDYLRKLFRSEIGSTPLRFLIDTRLQAAAERLDAAAEERMSISEIAHLCGFREPLYFSRVFRSRFGLSPQQYQNRPRSGGEEPPDSESIKIRL